MATYSFKVQLPPRRSGGTPDCDKWTFHHILPWKYFYCLSAILGYYYYGTVASFVRGHPTLNTPENRAGLLDTATVFAPIVVCNTSIVQSEGVSMMSLVEMERLINGLARTGGSIVDKISQNAVRLHDHFVECTSPVFGGFPGMDGNQRSDDPKSSMELTRPSNGDASWWSAVTDIGKLLERASLFERSSEREGCKDLKSSVYGDRVKFKLTNNDLDNILLANLRTVVTPRFNSSVLAFDEKSWLFHYNGSQWSFVIADDIYHYPSYRPDKSAFKFSVSTTNTHTNRSKHLPMTRCPGIDNEKNILRPTVDAAKLIK
ncbi:MULTISPECIES: hypothetical protein [Gammaproteobacteria]|uniref:Uncharacterized protein n=1 Tax=Bowmanella yangjiangensis TaxID=2811230 RepID=A0ABS3D345_9ALTE|nr:MULTISPECIES: hypothetical protein [Gammaproteobacteria]MBN7822811.1 hypothetical protein [Bowmanella yangjiangensis]WFC62541.1 hypothetical protein EWH21_12700 [Pseudomonas sp. REST10]|tara:strand:+ start:964 stop:1914 length:951 start_codon:yes stop_codon:yes gene_type:complete